MNGGKTMLTGLVLGLLFLVHLVFWNGFQSLVTLILGGVPLVCLIIGAVFCVMGVTDLKAGQTKAETADPSGSKE